MTENRTDPLTPTEKAEAWDYVTRRARSKARDLRREAGELMNYDRTEPPVSSWNINRGRQLLARAEAYERSAGDR